ncbi:SGNH/GDSL hydrolase family protein [Antrihabitans stalagmiti]|nr:SGNH/GDSL hydrolase family protein [Antrihabitans stalagmiti]
MTSTVSRRLLGAPILAALLLALGCSAPNTTVEGPAVPFQMAAPSLRLTALGDSIAAATNCDDCESFVALFGVRIAADRQRPVDVANLGVPGWTSDDLLDSLDVDSDDAETVRDSDVVTITIGANDFYSDLDTYFDGDCGGDDQLECFDPGLDRLQTTLDTVLRRVAELRDGRLTDVFVTGYWDVFPDGDVAEALYGPQFLVDSAALTRRANDVIAAAATRGHATYVDLFDVFKGRTGSDDPTDLLADDGDHPNQAGHRLIADALAAAAETAS